MRNCSRCEALGYGIAARGPGAGGSLMLCVRLCNALENFFEGSCGQYDTVEFCNRFAKCYNSNDHLKHNLVMNAACIHSALRTHRVSQSRLLVVLHGSNYCDAWQQSQTRYVSLKCNAWQRRAPCQNGVGLACPWLVQGFRTRVSQ